MAEDSATGAAKSNGRVCFWTSAKSEREGVREKIKERKRETLSMILLNRHRWSLQADSGFKTETDRMETTVWRD